MTDRLVTDAEAEEMAGMSGAMWIGYTTVDRLLATREALMEALPDPEKLELLAYWFDMDDESKGRTSEPQVQADLRRWANAIRALLAALHRDSTSGTSVPPETEEP